VALVETPFPHLILEYAPFGNLGELHGISSNEALAVLCQGLDALTAVHDCGVTHRDIKPANILIQSRDPLYIKLSDFGLAKAGSDLQTFCGTATYMAPELYSITQPVYTNAADIWSLGVVVLQCAYHLPVADDVTRGPSWCKKIMDQLAHCDPTPLTDLLSTSMVIKEPRGRLSARDCWVQASQLSVPTHERRDSSSSQCFIFITSVLHVLHGGIGLLKNVICGILAFSYYHIARRQRVKKRVQ
jgi:serine/threonine protein kinase